jgi:hypothetical protein
MDIILDINKKQNKAHPVGRHVEAKNKVKFLPHITPSPEIPAAKITAFMHASRFKILIFLSKVGSMIYSAKQLSPLSTPSSRVPA